MCVGKTYAALEALSAAYEAEVASGSPIAPAAFVYAGPLRMLAYEVYQKLGAKYGMEAVGFLTGEEQINPQAPIVAATVEMAPDAGLTLVLDETHWIADSERGQHWTDLLLKSSYRDYHVLCAAEALDTCERLLEDAASQRVLHFERKTPLRYKGFMSLARVPDRSAVVAFSRKGVYAIANMLQSRGRKVGVIYGALPLAVRKEQIQRYIDGEYEVMVTTDVIGHGINLPIDSVVFAQSEKFDGTELRALRTWEVAQIAGRAGRFGLSKEGSVFLLSGADWFSNDEKLIDLGVQAGAGQIRTDLQIREAIIAPTLSELGVIKAAELPIALEEWSRQARKAFEERSIGPASMAEVLELFYALAAANGLPTEPEQQREWPVALADLWQLISGPFNAKGRTVQQLFQWLQEPERAHSTLLSRYFKSLLVPLSWAVEAVGVANQSQLEALEASVAAVRELKMAHVMFGTLGDLLLPELLEAEDQLNSAINNTLAETIEAGKYGHCSICNAEIAPWFNLCYECNYEQQAKLAPR
jgi:ATP-dependent RNA helicase SUPV3L1/SUV3